MTTVLLILAGMLPCLFGRCLYWCLNWYVESCPDLFFRPEWMFYLSAALLLLLWFLISFAAFPFAGDSVLVVVPLHFVVAADLVLVKIQELVFFFFGIWIGQGWIGFSFIPLKDIGFTITNGRIFFFSAYYIPFCLLLAVSLAGCEIQKIRMMRKDNKEGEHL